MITQKTQEATYTLQTGPTLTARYHDGRTRRAVQVLVTSPAGARYSVLVPTDGGSCSCSCPDWQRRHKGTNSAGCKHVSLALGHLLHEPAENWLKWEMLLEAEREAAAVSPAIIAQVSEGETAAEQDARVIRERAWWD